MTALVDRLLPAASALDRAALVYLRTVHPISVALAIVRNLRINLSPLGEHRSAEALEDHLTGVPYPEQGVEEDLTLPGELLQLTAAGDARDLAHTHADTGSWGCLPGL